MNIVDKAFINRLKDASENDCMRYATMLGKDSSILLITLMLRALKKLNWIDSANLKVNP